VPFGNSLFAHNEQENVSPTCVEPNAGGKVSWLGQQYVLIVVIRFLLTIDPSMKSWSEDLEGKASDASEDILFVSRGRGYCWAREGLDNLPNILAFLAGSKSLAWLAHLRTAYKLVVVGPC
jgi:hypothetical protein